MYDPDVIQHACEIYRHRNGERSDRVGIVAVGDAFAMRQLETNLNIVLPDAFYAAETRIKNGNILGIVAGLYRMVDAESQPIIKEADPEFERLLAEEEALERSARGCT